MHVTFFLYTQVELRPKMAGESWWSQERKWLKFHTWRPLPADNGGKQPLYPTREWNDQFTLLSDSLWFLRENEWHHFHVSQDWKISQHDQTSRLPRDPQILSSSICWYSLSCSTLRQFQPNQKHPCLSPVPLLIICAPVKQKEHVVLC